MGKLLIVCFLFGVMSYSISFAQTKPFLNLASIAGKTPQEVEKVLGSPVSRQKTSTGTHPLYLYAGSNIEVVFTEGKADWIAIYGTENPYGGKLRQMAFDQSTLAALGLPIAAPKFSRSTHLRWDNYSGMKEIWFHKGGNLSGGGAGIKLIYICVTTCP